MGLDGPIPDDLPGLPLENGVELREWPHRYITPGHYQLMRLHRLHRNGCRLRDDGVLHWPAVLVQVVDLLDREVKTREAHAQ